MRKSWDEYFLDLADLVATRATCPRLHVGCVIVKNNRIIATGYNGSHPGDPHCEDVGCKLSYGHCKRTIHAEVNAVCEIPSPSGPPFTAYVTHTPCPECERQLIDCGVTRIVKRHEYPPVNSTLTPDV